MKKGFWSLPRYPMPNGGYRYGRRANPAGAAGALMGVLVIAGMLIAHFIFGIPVFN